MSPRDDPKKTDFEKALSERSAPPPFRFAWFDGAEIEQGISRDLELQESTIKLHVRPVPQAGRPQPLPTPAMIAGNAGFI